MCRQQTETIVAQRVHQLFQRLPMLSGFWLRPDLMRGRTFARGALMPAKTCADCRHSRRINGAMRCEEQRSNAIDGAIILDVGQAKRAASFEHICTLVAARCAFCHSVA